MSLSGIISKAFCRVCIVLSGLFLACGATAQTFVVNSTVDTNDGKLSDGICADKNKLCSLRAAIQESNALTGPDKIILGSGTYKLLIAGKAEDDAEKGDLDITEDLTLSGAGRDATIIDANGLDRVFHILGNSVATISGITVLNGSGGEGGGIFVSAAASLSISDCTVTGGSNSAFSSRGAGIHNEGQLLVENCIIKNNVSNYIGGGLNNDTGSSAIIKNTHIHDNTATYGGAIFVWSNSSLTLEGVTLSNNHATTQGGAITSWGGGAIIKLINSTVSGNRSEGNGGGIRIEHISLQISNSTITNNRAPSKSGIFNGGTITIDNSIVAGNVTDNGTASDCSSYGQINSLGFNLIGVAGSDCVINAQASDQIGTNSSPILPLLLPLADNGGQTPTHLLQETSPAINAGNPNTAGSNGVCAAVDQRGVTRINDSVCDIGAVEQTPIADLWVSMSNSSDVDADSGIVKQIVQVGNKGPNPAEAIFLVVKFPEGSVNHRATGNSWQCDFNSQQIDCRLPSIDFNVVSTLELLFWPPEDFTALTTKATLQSSTYDWQLDNNQFELELVGDKKTKEEVDFGEGDLSDTGISSTNNNSGDRNDGVSITSSNESNQLKQKNNPFMPEANSPESDWVVLLKLIKHDGSEAKGEDDDLVLSGIRQQLLSDFSNEEGGHIKRNAGVVGLGVVFFAGIVNMVMPTTSLFGFLFSFPLWTHLDPINLVSLSSKERKHRRKKHMNKQQKNDESSAHRKVLDSVSEKDQ